MDSVWTPPGADPGPYAVSAGSTATTSPSEFLKGNLSDRDREGNARWRLWPEAWSRLRAATRSTLGQ